MSSIPRSWVIGFVLLISFLVWRKWPAPAFPHVAFTHLTAEKIHEIRDFWKVPGRPQLIVIFGGGKKEEMESMASQIKEPVFIDYDGKFKKSLEINRFPGVVVIDSLNRIVAQGSAGIPWINDEINDHLNK